MKHLRPAHGSVSRCPQFPYSKPTKWSQWQQRMGVSSLWEDLRILFLLFWQRLAGLADCPSLRKSRQKTKAAGLYQCSHSQAGRKEHSGSVSRLTLSLLPYGEERDVDHKKCHTVGLSLPTLVTNKAIPPQTCPQAILIYINFHQTSFPRRF